MDGIEGSRRLYDTYTSAFPDLQFEIQQMVAENDIASARLLFTGTHEGPLGETPASGNFVQVANNCFFRFADGQAGSLFFRDDRAMRTSKRHHTAIGKARFVHPTDAISTGIVKAASALDQHVQAHQQPR